MAGSIATVYSKHIITACRTFRETNFVISLPIPRNSATVSPGDCLEFHERLREAFNSCLKANIKEFENVVLCANDNLGKPFVSQIFIYRFVANANAMVYFG